MPSERVHPLGRSIPPDASNHLPLRGRVVDPAGRMRQAEPLRGPDVTRHWIIALLLGSAVATATPAGAQSYYARSLVSPSIARGPSADPSPAPTPTPVPTPTPTSPTCGTGVQYKVPTDQSTSYSVGTSSTSATMQRDCNAYIAANKLTGPLVCFANAGVNPVRIYLFAGSAIKGGTQYQFSSACS